MTSNTINQIIKYVHSGKCEELKAAANLKAMLQERDSNNRTVLINAANVKCPHKRFTECIELMLRLGADPAAADSDGDTAAHVAARSGNLKMLAILPFNSKFLLNREGCTPLMEAVRKGRFRCVKHLLHLFRQQHYYPEKISLLNLKNKLGLSAMDMAKRSERGRDIKQDIIDILENEIALFLCDGKLSGLSSKQLEIYKQMKQLALSGNYTELQQVATRVHCDLPDETGRTVLSWAAAANISSSHSMQLTMHALIEIGDPTAADVNGATSLHYAALYQKVHAVGLLLDQGVPANIRDMQEQTPVMWAATVPSKASGTLLTLLSSGADHELEDSEGRTALWLSKSNTSNLALTTLIQGGATTSDENTSQSRAFRGAEAHHLASNAYPSKTTTPLDFIESKIRRLFKMSSRKGSLNNPPEIANFRPERHIDEAAIYPMTSPGLLVMFNVKNYDSGRYGQRTGSGKDVERLKEIAAELKFNVVLYEDRTAEELKVCLKKLANDTETLEKAGCLICVLMSHGENGAIVMKDGKKRQINKIIQEFNSSWCPSLKNKPKLFIVQACRGEGMDIHRSASASTDAGLTGDSTPYCRVESDIAVCYATTEGRAAYRSETEEEGSPFIQTLCEVLHEFHATEHMLDMLTIVNQRLGQRPIKCPHGDWYMVSQTVTQLSRKFYLRKS